MNKHESPQQATETAPVNIVDRGELRQAIEMSSDIEDGDPAIRLDRMVEAINEAAFNTEIATALVAVAKKGEGWTAENKELLAQAFTVSQVRAAHRIYSKGKLPTEFVELKEGDNSNWLHEKQRGWIEIISKESTPLEAARGFVEIKRAAEIEAERLHSRILEEVAKSREKKALEAAEIAALEEELGISV